MSGEKTFRIVLQPTGVELTAQQGASLRDLLFEQGVEFPCGGNGRCRGCKVRILKGNVAVDDHQREHLSEVELAAGWRLSCICHVQDDLEIELRQWDATILANDSAFEFTPQQGLGVAVDLGTTTLVAQLLDLQTGQVIGVKTALNPQARHGGDVMSRVQFAVAEGGQQQLQDLIRHEIGVLIRQLFVITKADATQLRKVVIVGNTVMHHLFCGIDVEPLSHFPFEPVNDGLMQFSADALGWHEVGAPTVEFLPCMGSFVGSDLLAGVLATGLHDSDQLHMLVDLGTNGEIVLGNRDGILCASTAAGPAFEGARIHMGMRASTGAIWKVAPTDGGFACEALGNVAPRGICGSGLVDAVAAGLELKAIKPGGRLASGDGKITLSDPVTLSQTDIRQLQLAKGAIAAGITIMLEQMGVGMEDVSRLYLAGAFGNYINRRSAQRIGLLHFPLEKVQPVGNTALLGAKLALFSAGDDGNRYTELRATVRHLSLNEDPRFQDVYVEEMGFPTE